MHPNQPDGPRPLSTRGQPRRSVSEGGRTSTCLRLRAQDAAALAAFLPYAETLDLTDDAAARYAEIRADLKKRGMMIGANDLFIAAHARARGLTLVTNNTAEFEGVSDMAIENWTLPPGRRR